MTIKHQQKKEDEMIITNQKELLKELLQEKAAQQKEYAIVIAKQEELLEEKRGISALQKELLAGKDLIIANRNSDIADLKVLLSGHIASQNSALDSALEKLQKQLQGPLSVHSPLHQ